MFGIYKLDQGKAMLITDVIRGKVTVSFTGGLVMPILQKVELIDLTLKNLSVVCEGENACTSRDGTRVDMRCTFLVRISKTEENVRFIAQTIGCEQASDEEALTKLFSPNLAEAMDRVCREFDFDELTQKPKALSERLVQEVETFLEGFTLDGCSVDRLTRSTT